MMSSVALCAALALAVVLAGASFAAVAGTSTSPAAGPATGPARRAGDVAVMSFNVRYLNDRDGDNNWEFRKTLVTDAIHRFAPDLLGTQEVRSAQLGFLSDQLREQYHVIPGLTDTNATNGEHQAIFVRRGRFEPVERGQFWLSETPEAPGSRGWDADKPRAVNWVRVRDLSTGADGRELLFINTHWDHQGEVARQESAALMRRWLAERVGDGRLPVVITGDFNDAPDTPSYDRLMTPPDAPGPKLVDTYREVCSRNGEPEEQTFHAFTGQPRSGRIDWIIASEQLDTEAADVDEWNVEGRYPSDHFPVWALLRLKEATTEPTSNTAR